MFERSENSEHRAERVGNTHPSHALPDYTGEYEHPAYGVLKIGMKDGQLQFDFRKLQFPMSHFHYDRFDTPDDERFGKWSVNFGTNPQGEIDTASMSLDEAAVVFTRRPEVLDAAMIAKLAGTYETPEGFKFQVTVKQDGNLFVKIPGEPEEQLLSYKGLKFRVKDFADVVLEFVVENGQVKALKERDPSGENVFVRK